LILIESNQKIGVTTPSAKFAELNSSFKRVFPFFPQDYNFRVTYQHCESLSNNLITDSSYNAVSSFMDNCYKQLKGILTKINSNYTVKANAVVNPKS
jgi:hypothetical protein